jgi:ATPase subunit of ABC transporter with duplicated ATPase domains
VFFEFDGAEKYLIDDLSASFNQDWTGVVGSNGCGKSTLLKILTGDYSIQKGEISKEGISIEVFCPQDTLDEVETFREFCESYEKAITVLKTKLDLHELCHRQWHELSHGEQKRFQLGCALAKEPDLLVVDEPTNHLDEPNREFVLKALKSFSGIGIVVSHDRVFLNSLCSRILLHNGQRFQMFQGNYEQAKTAIDDLRNSSSKRIDSLEKKMKSIDTEISRVEKIDQNSAGRLSKGDIGKKDRDAKEKVNLAKLTGKDASLGKKKQQLNARLERLGEEKRNLSQTKDYSNSIFFAERDRKNRTLLNLPSQQVPLLDGTKLNIPDLTLNSNDKIAIVGPNGTGKSTLLNWLFRQSEIRSDQLLYLKQELEPEEIAQINSRLKALDKDTYGRCLQIFARLGSDAKQVFKSNHRSPGEVRKLAISLAIVNEVDLLILDEPTNHLDLPSIEKLEDALSLCSIALLLVSHDAGFVDNVANGLWRLERQPDGHSHLQRIAIDNTNR